MKLFSFVILSLILSLNSSIQVDNSLELAAGFWTGKIAYSETKMENILIRIYDHTIETQKGYLVIEGSKYQLITINDVYMDEDSIEFSSNHMAVTITGTYDRELKQWKCSRIYGKKEYIFTNNLILKRVSQKPDWALGIRHIIYKDGVYEATMEPSRWGHRPYCRVTVKNNRITDVQYYEKHDSTGQLKDKNYGKEYIEEFGETAHAGAQLSVAGASVYGPRLVLSQNLENVDVVTGATVNYHRFQTVVGKALAKAVIFSE